MPESLLRRAAERAAADDFFLASALLPYARSQGWNDDALAERLRCRPDDLPRLLLCRRPRSEPADFRADVEGIAEAFELAPATLAETIRLADSVRALRKAGETIGGPESASGWLAAARDRESAQRESAQEEGTDE